MRRPIILVVMMTSCVVTVLLCSVVATPGAAATMGGDHVATPSAVVGAEAVTCSAAQLAPCASAILFNQPPSASCCGRVREQKPCLCGYLRNPSLGQYVNSPGARKVASTCGVSPPRC